MRVPPQGRRGAGEQWRPDKSLQGWGLLGQRQIGKAKTSVHKTPSGLRTFLSKSDFLSLVPYCFYTIFF
jgi:hypothetical protein